MEGDVRVLHGEHGASHALASLGRRHCASPKRRGPISRECAQRCWRRLKLPCAVVRQETVAAKVGGLEGQLQTAAADVERTSSERRLTQVKETTMPRVIFPDR